MCSAAITSAMAKWFAQRVRGVDRVVMALFRLSDNNGRAACAGAPGALPVEGWRLVGVPEGQRPTCGRITRVGDKGPRMSVVSYAEFLMKID